MTTREIKEYVTANGKAPFREWLEDLRDSQARSRIRLGLRKFSIGYAGDIKTVGSGVSELRFHFGPGYRVYFGYHQHLFVLLLCGGDKSTQTQDILKAQAYWRDFLRRQNE